MERSVIYSGDLFGNTSLGTNLISCLISLLVLVHPRRLTNIVARQYSDSVFRRRDEVMYGDTSVKTTVDFCKLGALLSNNVRRIDVETVSRWRGDLKDILLYWGAVAVRKLAKRGQSRAHNTTPLNDEIMRRNISDHNPWHSLGRYEVSGVHNAIASLVRITPYICYANTDAIIETRGKTTKLNLATL